MVLPYILCLALAYACSLSSRVLAFDDVEPDGESSEPGTTDPGREPLVEDVAFCARCMILIFGCAVSCVGARSAKRNAPLDISY